MTADLTRDDVGRRTLADGFLPITAPDNLPLRDRRVGLRELGLPYETEPAITRHLAAFLTRGGRGEAGSLAKPDVVWLNGGFSAPPIARERVLLALERWFGARPMIALENEKPEAAVALGAASTRGCAAIVRVEASDRGAARVRTASASKTLGPATSLGLVVPWHCA